MVGFLKKLERKARKVKNKVLRGSSSSGPGAFVNASATNAPTGGIGPALSQEAFQIISD